MNKKVYEIIKSYGNKPNTPETRAQLIRELGNELLVSAPTFEGHLVDCTSLVEEQQGKINIQISYKDRMYNIKEFRHLANLSEN